MKRKRSNNGEETETADNSDSFVDANELRQEDSNSPPPQPAGAKRKSKLSKHLHNQKMKQKYKPKAEVSTTDIKKRIRDTERLLSRRDNLNADVQIDLERRLKALKAQLMPAEEMVDDRETMKRNYEKYKYVRFVGGLLAQRVLALFFFFCCYSFTSSSNFIVFSSSLLERQKVTRKLKQITRQLSLQPDSSDLQSQKLDLESRLEYTIHYPLLFKYVSLFADSGIETEDKDNKSGVLRSAILEEISMRLESGEQVEHTSVGKAVRRRLRVEFSEMFPELAKKKKRSGGEEKKKKDKGGKKVEETDKSEEEKIVEKPAKKSKLSQKDNSEGSFKKDSSKQPSLKPSKPPKPTKPTEEPPANPFADDDFFAADDDEDDSQGAKPKQFVDPELAGFAKRRGGKNKKKVDVEKRGVNNKRR